jgi:phosphatidylglycerophosphate synthase
MTRVDQHAPRALDAARPRAALADLAIGLALALGAVGATWRLLGLPASYLLVGTALYGALAALVLRTLPADRPGPGIGMANRVTLARAALAMPVFALSLHPAALGPGARWWIIALSTAVLLLDGVDGRVARRTGSHTRFGARFDMELDAALLMALSLLVWRSGRVGPWVLLIGLMRYLFVAASRVVPALAAELPPSLRRRLVCVVQGVVLLVALGPIIPQPVAVAVTAAGLLALAYSFAADVGWALAE